ncbi:hypothetical protein EAL2_808p04020 (plasmid) [Peptoclostridium acidaminophilum DSM 3953]|uniref:Uncharacterized protein n=1 Tax=Peptoclostridium acidaminophilum DSM 3953 TaxID=1286171 RepID=W8UAS8_PEPAC|nr:hypothetical protein [Peptoclostridium acidaminophilum]AHM57906.1 hypothetical protein EAL2_808p04020 [Peptoclostridium acidaminophilum DSM 3953]
MRLKIKDINIDKEQVKKFLGYASKPCPPIILKKIDEEMERAAELFEPEVLVKRFKIDSIKGAETRFGGTTSIQSEYVAQELEDSIELYLALYTIGNRIEKRINEHSIGSEMIRAMILDKIGVVALDDINRQLKEAIEEESAPYKISAQIFPSQRDFEISNQKMIFEALEAEISNITISSHFQFNPIKTVAVIFGMGSAADKLSMCDRCENKCF